MKKAKKKVVKKVKKSVKKNKKVIKKTAKKAVKKTANKAVTVVKRSPIGEVTHFYDKICVAVVKFQNGVQVGEEICFEGPKESFSQILESMQYEHESLEKAKKGQEVGVKTKKPVKEGYKVYKAK